MAKKMLYNVSACAMFGDGKIAPKGLTIAKYGSHLLIYRNVCRVPFPMRRRYSKGGILSRFKRELGSRLYYLILLIIVIEVNRVFGMDALDAKWIVLYRSIAYSLVGFLLFRKKHKR